MKKNRIEQIVKQFLNGENLILSNDKLEASQEELDYLCEKNILKKEFDSCHSLLGYSCTMGCLALLKVA